MSGLLHQSNGRRASPDAVIFEAEKAIPEKAYRSQMTVVPEVKSFSILVLYVFTKSDDFQDNG